VGKSKAPDPPDYAAAAKEQGTANVSSAIASNYLNQANQVGPYGSLTYSYSGNNITLPDGSVVPQTTATTTLSPEQQKLYEQQTGISTSLNDLATKGIGYVDKAVSTPVTSASVGGPGLSTGLARTQFDPTADPTQLGIQSGYDFSELGAMPKASDFQGQRDQITDAYMARLQPYLDKQRSAMDVKLANQGITHGSEAYGWDNDILNRGENDQRIAALLAGDQEQQNMFQNAMGIRSQGVGEAVAQGNFGNQAQQQEFGQSQQELENANQAAQANFGQGLASSQFQNQARSQAIQEADYFQNQPLNMLNALRSGGQVNLPQFGNVSAGNSIAPAPVYAAAGDQYAAQMQNYQAQMQQQQALMSGIGSIAGAAITASDRRLKTGIKYLYTRLDGLRVYLYHYLWGGPQYLGVMADEVAVKRPDALGPVINGFATVDYGVLRHAG
jgi:hypothetical protein